jgi:hypothetical protein
MLASMFSFLQKKYDLVIEPFASEPPTGKNFLANQSHGTSTST